MAAELLKSRVRPEVGVDSAGLYEGAPDPFLPSILKEIGLSVGNVAPKSLEGMDLSGFHNIVALTSEAVEALSVKVPPENLAYWPTENPTDSYGARDQILDAYRRVRGDLTARIAERFADFFAKT